jgi:hypothetical protein
MTIDDPREMIFSMRKARLLVAFAIYLTMSLTAAALAETCDVRRLAGFAGY